MSLRSPPEIFKYEAVDQFYIHSVAMRWQLLWIWLENDQQGKQIINIWQETKPPSQDQSAHSNCLKVGRSKWDSQPLRVKCRQWDKTRSWKELWDTDQNKLSIPPACNTWPFDDPKRRTHHASCADQVFGHWFISSKASTGGGMIRSSYKPAEGQSSITHSWLFNICEGCKTMNHWKRSAIAGGHEKETSNCSVISKGHRHAAPPLPSSK